MALELVVSAWVVLVPLVPPSWVILVNDDQWYFNVLNSCFSMVVRGYFMVTINGGDL